MVSESVPEGYKETGLDDTGGLGSKEVGGDS